MTNQNDFRSGTPEDPKIRASTSCESKLMFVESGPPNDDDPSDNPAQPIKDWSAALYSDILERAGQGSSAVDEKPMVDTGHRGLRWRSIFLFLLVVLLAVGSYTHVHNRLTVEYPVGLTRASAENHAREAAMTDMERRYRELQATVESLKLENRQLRHALEATEYKARISKLYREHDGVDEVNAIDRDIPQPSVAHPPTEQGTPASGGDWFVNFGSYLTRETAEYWSHHIGTSGAVVTTAEQDGRTIYRVRVVGLASREAAERVARALEQDHQMDRLWIGMVGATARE